MPDESAEKLYSDLRNEFAKSLGLLEDEASVVVDTMLHVVDLGKIDAALREVEAGLPGYPSQEGASLADRVVAMTRILRLYAHTIETQGVLIRALRGEETTPEVVVVGTPLAPEEE